MDGEFTVICFRLLKSDPCVFIYENETDFVILTLYVDDTMFLSASKILLNNLEKQLMDRFEISNMGDVSTILGMNVTRDSVKGAITISQKD